MNFGKRFLPQILLGLATLSMVACSTPEKASLPADAEPRAELQKLDADQGEALANQYDRLSPDNFKKSVKYRNEAVEAFEKNKPREEVLEQIAVSRRFLEKAQGVGSKYAPIVKPILDSRKAAMDAEAPRLIREKFMDTEEDFADVGEDMEASKFKVDADLISGLEGDYRRLEINARKEAALGEARKNVERAIDDGAGRNASSTLELTQTLITSAERAIDISPRDPAGYNEQVQKAHYTAQKLREVLEIAKSRGINESAALTIWEQNQKLAASQQQLQETKQMTAEQQAQYDARLAAQAATMGQQSRQLSAVEQRNQSLAEREELNAKIEEMRKKFSSDEAEVLKQGNNLIVRLKKMDFASGESNLGPSSFETLRKIQDLIAVVPAEQIVIEGHTDSTGSAKVNQPLSEKRAESVKQYLVSQGVGENTQVEAKGYGSDKPLVTNKTKEGRATNRRVDVVIETSTTL